MSSRIRLGDLQLAIMKVLWNRREATVAEVHEDLKADRDLAPTTVATMLTKMERKGVIDHRKEGRRFVYRPTVSEDHVCRSMVGTLTDQLFQGQPAALVSHLLSEHEIDAAELGQLKTLIQRLEQKEGN